MVNHPQQRLSIGRIRANIETRTNRLWQVSRQQILVNYTKDASAYRRRCVWGTNISRKIIFGRSQCDGWYVRLSINDESSQKLQDTNAENCKRQQCGNGLVLSFDKAP